MKQPWMKFYPTDWRSDPALRQCSMAARGLWIHMISIMHEADEYGELAVKRTRMTVEMLAKDASINPRTTRLLLAELEAKGVFERDESGTIYSRRMKREKQRSQIYTANGSRGGNPKLLNQLDKPLDNQTPQKLDNQKVNPQVNTQKLEARSKKERSPLTPLTGGKRAQAKRTLPADFGLTEERRQCGRDRGWNDARTTSEFARFTDSALAHNRAYANWDAAWRNWTTSNFQQEGNVNGNGRVQATRSVQQAAYDLHERVSSKLEEWETLFDTPGDGVSESPIRLLPKR